jgi:hypothetical protein
LPAPFGPAITIQRGFLRFAIWEAYRFGKVLGGTSAFRVSSAYYRGTSELVTFLDAREATRCGRLIASHGERFRTAPRYGYDERMNESKTRKPDPVTPKNNDPSNIVAVTAP